MRSIAIVAVLAVLAIAAQSALAEDCSGGACTATVAVIQTFATADCSGNGTLETYTDYTESCYTEQYTGFNRTYILECSSSKGLVTYANFDSNSCAIGEKTLTFVENVGVCQLKSQSRSTITWCNEASISNNFAAVTNATATGIPVMPVYACNATTGCPDDVGTARYYSEAGCNDSSLVQVYPPSTLLNMALTLDECSTTNQSTLITYDDRQNVLATCKNGQYLISYSTNGCGASADHFTSSSYPTDQCFRYSTNSWIYITCPATPTTPPVTPTTPATTPTTPPATPTTPPAATPTTPPSDASALIAGGKLIFAILLVAFLFI